MLDRFLLYSMGILCDLAPTFLYTFKIIFPFMCFLGFTMKFHSSSDFTHGVHSTSNALSTSFTHENMTYASKLSLLISSYTEPSQLPQAWPQL